MVEAVRVLVTGATGFVGRNLCEVLARAGYTVRAALRADSPLPPSVSERVVVGDLAGPLDWKAALKDVACVAHVAARVHVLRQAPGSEHLTAQVNVHGTQRLVEAAAHAAVRRLLFLSSVKVNGEQSPDRGYAPSDEPHPVDAYARSKWAAEEIVRDSSAKAGMEAVIVRAPLVYGAGVRANFLRLMAWVDSERILPFGAVHNRRSLVSVWNLCDLLRKALEHPLAPGKTWMVSDGEDLSTPELVRRIARAMGRRPRLIAVPGAVLRFAGTLTGRRAEIARLCGSLTVDISATRRELGWSPPLTVDEALERTARWYFSREPERDA